MKQQTSMAWNRGVVSPEIDLHLKICILVLDVIRCESNGSKGNKFEISMNKADSFR